MLYYLKEIIKSFAFKKLSAKLLLLIFLSWSNHTALAQQPQVYNQFFMNPYIYNPAYAGVEGTTSFFVTYRDQWTNIESAPTLADFNFHVPLKGGIALGAAAFNIKQGLLQTSAAKVTASYLINIDRTHFLRLGMSLGSGINSVNLDEIADVGGDPAVNGFVDQSSFFLGDFGATYHFGHFNVGFSLPNLFSYNPITQREISTPEFDPIDNILFKMNYRGHINDNFAFEPHIIYRYSNVIPHQYEAVLIAHLYHIVWVGGAYRQDSEFIGLAGAKIKEKFAVGVSYELGNSKVSKLIGPTLEITLGYHLGKKKNHAEHVASFIKSHRLSAEERAKKAEMDRQKQLAELQSDEGDGINADDITNSKLNSSLKSQTSKSNIPTVSADDWVYQKDQPKLTRVNQFGEEEIGSRLEKIGADEKNVVISWLPTSEANNFSIAEKGHLERDLPDDIKEVGVRYEKLSEDGSVEYVIKWDRAITENQANIISTNKSLSEDQHDQIEKSNPNLTQDFRTHDELASSSDHVSVRRGSHLLELPPGNFVIVGAFSVFEHAEKFSDELFQEGFYDSFVGFSSARGYYYVVVSQSNTIEIARARRDDLRKSAKLSKAWVLEVIE